MFIQKLLSGMGVAIVVGSLFVVMGVWARDLGLTIKDKDECWASCHEECRGQKPDPEVVDRVCYCYCLEDRTTPVLP